MTSRRRTCARSSASSVSRDIDVVRGEGLAYGPEQREAAIGAAPASVTTAEAGIFHAKAA